MQRPVIAFDVVGTLLHPEPGVAEVYARVGSSYGSRLTVAEVGARLRKVFRDREERDRGGDLTTSEAAERDRWREIVTRVLFDVCDPDRCFEELFRHFGVPDSWTTYPEVPSVLERIRSLGGAFLFASNFDHRLRTLVDTIPPLRETKALVVSSEVGYRKPHPLFFEAVRAAAQVPAGEILFVGDDPENDVAGARAAGMQAVLLSRDAPGGDLRSLDELTPRRV